MRTARLAISFVVICLAGCECDLSSPELPRASASMGDEATGLFTPTEGHPYRTFVDANGTFHRDMAFEDRLRLVDVHPTATGWEAEDARTFEYASRYPFGFGGFARETSRCTGSARFADGAWTLEFSDTSCAERSGVYRREEVVLAERIRVACERYRDCACPMVAGPHGGLFAPYCEAAERMMREPPDEPTTCSGYLVREIASGLHLEVPEACSSPSR